MYAKWSAVFQKRIYLNQEDDASGADLTERHVRNTILLSFLL